MKNLILAVLLFLPLSIYTFDINDVRKTIDNINWEEEIPDYTVKIVQNDNTITQIFIQKEWEYVDSRSAIFLQGYTNIYTMQIENTNTNVIINVVGFIKKDKHPDLLFVDKLEEGDIFTGNRGDSLIIKDFFYNIFITQAKEDNWVRYEIYNDTYTNYTIFNNVMRKTVAPFQWDISGDIRITVFDRSEIIINKE